MGTIHLNPKVLILRMGKVPFIDTTAEANFKNIVRHFKRQGGLLLVSGIGERAKKTLVKSGLYDEIGEDFFFEHTGEAISYALERINKTKCIGCPHQTFHECVELCQHLPNKQEPLVKAHV